MNYIYMVTFNCNIFSYIVLILLDSSHCLLKLPQAENDAIQITEAIIRDTINVLFRTLKLNEVKEKSRLNDYTILHKYFMDLTLQNNVNLNNIARLTKVDHNHFINVTNFVKIIDDLLEEDNHETEKNEIENDMNVTTYIENFLENLRLLEKAFNVPNVYVNINTDVLELLKDQNVNLMNKTSTTESIVNKSDENDIIDKNDFWEPSGRRLFKGERTKIKHYSFMATIQIFNSFHCAGSIIKSDLIITASSCLQLAWNNRFFRENPAFLAVRVGSSFYQGGGEVIPVLEIYFHPEYDPKTLRNNICILRLIRRLKFTRSNNIRLKKIDFDRHASNLPMNTPPITVVGWGAKEHSQVIGDPWKNIISYAALDVYPLKDCQDTYSREYVSHKNFCAGFISRGGGACNRDVGGPGIVGGKLMGIISFGSPVCGMPDAPTVFTKVGYYTDWIEDIMEQDVPMRMKLTTLKPSKDPLTTPPLYVPSKTTKFKIPPITGKTMTPIPISQIDSQLRVINQDTFKEFLVTMFNSKEINDYKDILQDFNFGDPIKEGEIIPNDAYEDLNTVTEATEIIEQTQLIDGSVGDESAKNNFHTAYTVTDQVIVPISDDFDEELSKLMNNVDLESIVKEEVMVSPNIVKQIDNEDKRTESLTAVYLSDDVKNKNVEINQVDGDKNEDEKGMSIPTDAFKDLTRSKKNPENVLPESLLLDLLSEVIREEVVNIAGKSLMYFYFLEFN